MEHCRAIGRPGLVILVQTLSIQVCLSALMSELMWLSKMDNSAATAQAF